MTVHEGEQDGREEPVRYLSWGDVAPVVDGFRQSPSLLAPFQIFHDELPEELATLQGRQLAPEQQPRFLWLPDVLDAELVP